MKPFNSLADKVDWYVFFIIILSMASTYWYAIFLSNGARIWGWVGFLTFYLVVCILRRKIEKLIKETPKEAE